MRLITKDSLIKSIKYRWHEAKPCEVKIYDQLKLLPEEATELDITNIIGNSSWTHIECSECTKPVDAAVVFGVVDEPESEGAYVCMSCLKAASDLSAAYEDNVELTDGEMVDNTKTITHR